MNIVMVGDLNEKRVNRITSILTRNMQRIDVNIIRKVTKQEHRSNRPRNFPKHHKQRSKYRANPKHKPHIKINQLRRNTAHINWLHNRSHA